METTTMGLYRVCPDRGFPKFRGTFWALQNKDYTILGSPHDKDYRFWVVYISLLSASQDMNPKSNLESIWVHLVRVAGQRQGLRHTATIGSVPTILEWFLSYDIFRI